MCFSIQNLTAIDHRSIRAAMFYFSLDMKRFEILKSNAFEAVVSKHSTQTQRNYCSTF